MILPVTAAEMRGLVPCLFFRFIGPLTGHAMSNTAVRFFHITRVPGNHVAVEMHDRLTLRAQYVLLCPGPTCSTWAPGPSLDWDGSVSSVVNVKSL
jgi:hypothetical protein